MFIKTFLGCAIFVCLVNAHAATVTNVTTATATLNFNANPTLTHTLTPAQSTFEAKTYPAGTVFANGLVKASVGNPDIAIVWHYDAEEDPGGIDAIVHGTNDPSHTINLQFHNSDGSIINVPADHLFNGKYWAPLKADGIYTIENEQDVTIAADEYVVSVDAGIWNS